jgi:isopenicillin N synthase-like dioxygenase
VRHPEADKLALKVSHYNAGDLLEFRAAMEAYYEAMEPMTTRLVPVVATGAGPVGGLFRRGLRRAELTKPGRSITHRTTSRTNEQVGVATHTENNFPTFLAQSALTGFEVRTAEWDSIGHLRSPELSRQHRRNAGALYTNDRFCPVYGSSLT